MSGPVPSRSNVHRIPSAPYSPECVTVLKMEHEKIGLRCAYRGNANYMHTRTAGWVITVEYSGMHALWEGTRGDDFFQCKKSIKATIIFMKYMLQLRNIKINTEFNRTNAKCRKFRRLQKLLYPTACDIY